MTSNTERADSNLEAQVAEKYKAQGFDVIVAPKREDLPFDLGTYRPDLIVRRAPNEGYIVEVKGTVSRMPIDRYREIAELVSQHVGWSFLLITGEDVSSGDQEEDKYGLLTWEQMRQRQGQAKELLSLGVAEGAFLTLWGILEAALRQQAKRVSIPIERFPTLSLMNHLYSQGELTMQQFDQVKALLRVRNRFIHGYQAPDLDDPSRQLQEVVKELLELWGNQ